MALENLLSLETEQLKKQTTNQILSSGDENKDWFFVQTNQYGKFESETS